MCILLETMKLIKDFFALFRADPEPETITVGVELPVTTNEECVVLSIVEDVLGVTDSPDVYIIRNAGRHIDSLGTSWRALHGGMNPKGLFWENVYYINTDIASKGMKPVANTYLKLLMGCGYGMGKDEKTLRRKIHAEMIKNHI